MAEVRASACRYGAHCAGVMAPACSLDVWLPRNCCETRGGPRYCSCARDNAEGRHPLPAAYTNLKEGEAPQVAGLV